MKKEKKKRKTIQIKLRNLDYETFNNLSDKCKHAKNLYNQALYKIMNHYNLSGEYLNYNAMDKIMKEEKNLEGNINYYLLYAQSSQQLLRRLDKNFKSFFAALKDYKENKHKYKGRPQPPNYIKLDDNKKEIIHYNTIFTFENSSIKGNKIQLVKGIIIDLPKDVRNKKLQTIEIIPKNNYFIASFVFVDENEYEQIAPNNNKMAIDLGVNNLITCVINTNNRPLIINGRPTKSINQFFNKKKAKKQKILKKRNNRYFSKSIQKLQEKADNKIKDQMHKVSNAALKYVLKNKISHVVIGGVLKGMINIAKNSSKKNNQNFVQIKLGQCVSHLRCNLERHGVKVDIQEESYTSKCSSVDYEEICKHKKYLGKRKGRLFITALGRVLNADVNGAFNILRKAFPNIKLSKNGVEALFRPYKLTV